jgi:uncharacterized protein YndB with AHSA1/START domain
MARTDTASRVIAAPLDRVFAALLDPEALTAWLPPDGMDGRFERFDARPGGSYRLVLTYPDASTARGKATADSDIVEARFVDVVPGVDFVSDDPTHAGTMTMTWEVAAVDAGTRVDIRADDVPAGISARDHAADSPLHSPTSPPTSSSNGSGQEVQASARAAGLSVPDRGRLPDATLTRPTRSARKRKRLRDVVSLGRLGVKVPEWSPRW